MALSFPKKEKPAAYATGSDAMKDPDQIFVG
jgi:hypothetical protein